MNAHQALARLRKAIGPKLLWRENHGAPLEEERQRQANIAKELRIDQNRLRAERDALRDKLLSDTEYVRLCDQYNDVKQRAELAMIASHRYPIQVGRNFSGMFFEVKVEGDNWEDVIRRAKEKGILK